MARGHRESTYEGWIKEQGLPIVTGHGVENILDLPLAPWARLGGRGTFVKLEGMEGVTGMYVAEIAAGGSLNPEKHLYEEIIYILRGRGATEVRGLGGQKRSLFEWQAGTLFALPLNAWHELSNGSGSEPATILGFTNAPMILDIYHNPDFVFGCDYEFGERYDGRLDYFGSEGSRYISDMDGTPLWETNFVPDVRIAPLDAREAKGAGVKLTQMEMTDGVLVTHIADWPVGRYQKFHHHGAGAVLLIVRGIGYTLMWPREAGTRPWESGNADEVVRISWREGSVFSPPHGWFHGHLNTGREPARQLAMRYGSRRYGVEFHDVTKGEGVMVDLKRGGTLIEYEDEDPEIRRMFTAECAQNGVEVDMPQLAPASSR